MTKDLQGLKTEDQNPESSDLDRLDTESMLRVINDGDQKVALAVQEAIPQIAKAVDAIADAIRSGGRVHGFGAGTSGRIAVLDTSEMHPTFGVPRDLFQGHMAGGPNALTDPVEGAEDDRDAGAQEVRAAGISDCDAVIGIAASGRTPYVLGALEAANSAGAVTIAVTCMRPAPALKLAQVPIATPVGPEVLTGSTRMKAGTAQKLVMNMISTGAMVRLGRTYGNLMVGVTPTNVKLKDRAVRLVRTITQKTEDPKPLLEAAGWDVRVACLMSLRDQTCDEARAALDRSDGSLRKALETTAK